MAFVHLHNHTQYSLLDGACRVDKMISMAKEMGMSAVAMTDHGNMFGTIDFYNVAKKNDIKPIVGIEAYVINSDLDDSNNKKDKRYHLVLLAKNITGYKNLIKLTSESYTKGFYYKPRISKKLLREHSEGVICLSACLQGEIPQLLLQNKKDEAIQTLEDYKSMFPGRYYLEIQDHGLDDEKKVMPKVIELANETNTPLVVTNDCHYLRKKDAEAHDILLCIQTGKSVSDPKRLRYSTEELYFKSEEEMRQLFPGLDSAYDNTAKIADEIDLILDYDDFLLPEIEVPAEYNSMGEYLKFLCYEAADKKYPELTQEIKDRIKTELDVINGMGYDGYFLVVKDFIDAARIQDVPVGPGRGSAAGSIVSFLLGITTVDPIKYGLLFERFLTEDRIGMPDIDIDFCAEGRGKVLDYVVNKYGRDCVTQIVTFGTLGAKSTIKDVARTLDLPAAEANRITKLMPSTPKITIEKALDESQDFRDLMNSNEQYKSILAYSKVLEGLVRQIGVHACGVVIAPSSLNNYIPLAISNQKGGDPVVLSQFEGKWLDDLKMLKMDFLGLKTLTLIKKTCALIKDSTGTQLNMDEVSLEDTKAFELLSKGQTDGVFQFESAGMKKYLIDLKPNVFEDLIAMVALYRPGPMQFIDTFIKRKHGIEEINYDHPLTRSALKETYGVTVYQEQVMQISRDMGGFSGSEADTLRKAMGKKKIALMEKLKVKFLEGAGKNEVDLAIVEKIWSNWQEFAKYAFNKSHATCYALVAYHTAYLKAHYPVEFMAALLTLEENPSKIPYFIEECKSMQIEVVPPNINISLKEFHAFDGKILFGLRGIKNVGDAAINSILNEREKNGKFKSIFDFTSRVDSAVVNKAVVESLICAGGMDEFEGTRSQLYAVSEHAMEYGSNLQKEKKRGQLLLFDMLTDDSQDDQLQPDLPEVEDWTFSEKLENEKKVLGYYISGHPLQRYKHMIDLLANIDTKTFESRESKTPGRLMIFGLVSAIMKKIGAKGNPFAIVTFEDLYGKFEISLFNSDFDKYFHYLKEGEEFFICGEKSTYSGNDDQILRIVPSKIIPLNQLSTKLSGDFYCYMNEETATMDFANEFTKIAGENPGKFNIHFNVKTEKYKMLKLHPRKIKIFPNNNVISFISQKMKQQPTARISFEN